MIKKQIFILLFLTLISFSFVQPSLSQETAEELTEEQLEELEELDPKNQAKGIKDKVTFRGNDFRRSTYQNMTKLYWYYGFPDIENNEHIDIFFQVNECDLYEKYYGDEFEWGPLRETMRDYLRSSSSNFSRRLYFDLPIEVGIYNVEKGNFTVESKNFNSAERDFFPHPTYVGWNKNFCGYSNPLAPDNSYPREGLFRLIRPINVPHIKVEEAQAKQLVRKWKEKEAEKRYLAIRIYLTITKYVGLQDFSRNKSVPVYLAYLEGYEIYEDLTMENLLFSKNFTKKKKGEIPSLTNASSESSSDEDEYYDEEDADQDEEYESEETSSNSNDEEAEVEVVEEEASELESLKDAPSENKKIETVVEINTAPKEESSTSSQEDALSDFE